MKKLAAFFLFLMLSVPAYAVGTMIITAAYGAAFATTTAGIAAAMAINFAVSMVVNRIFAPKMPKAGQTGVREQIPPSSVNSLPVVYGDAYLGGMFIDAALSQSQKTMYYVLAISSISPNGQFSYDTTKFYYGDRLITFDGTDQTRVASLTDGNGNVNNKIDGRLFINLYVSNSAGVITSTNGAPAPHVVMGYNALDDSTVPASLAWPSSGRQMYNTAFAIVKLNYSATAGVTSLDTITFNCHHHLNSTGVAKPGDVWYDYLTNIEYGGAADPLLVNSTSATALNTYSDQLISYTNSSGNPATQPRYRINGVIDTSKPVLENIENILNACDSWMTFDAASGQWAIVINKAESPALAFDDSNIVEDIRIGVTNINNSYNQVEIKFPSKENKDIPNYVYLETPAGLLYPNEPINKLTTTFDLVNDSVQAQYLANRILEQAREDLVVTIKTTYYGIQATAGDVVSVTNTTYGWSNKLFRVMKVNEASLPDGQLGATLELNEYNAQVYDDKPITQFQPSPNSLIPDIGFFGTLNAPTVTDQLPNAAVPTFAVEVQLPSLGQITMVSLYYTTVSTPGDADWILWGTQVRSSATPFTNGTNLKFQNINLPTNTYYFAFKVANQTSESGLSSISTSYNWLPNPSSSAVAGTFVATFSPAVLEVPFNVSPILTGIAPQLYGTTTGGSVDFIPAQDDSDPTFVNNTWRIGGSSTTGYGDIVKTNVTVGNPTDGGFYAQFPQPSAMSNEPAYIEVPVRYKSSAGVVSQGATAILQLTFNRKGDQGDPGVDGTQTGIAYLYQWSPSQPLDPNGTSDFVWATATNQTYTGGNGWATTIPANPGTPSIKLWEAAKGVSDTATAVITTVSWASGFSISAVGQNGATGTTGVQTATAIVYQWAATIPAGPSGTSTYTWGSGTFTPTPAGWTLTPGTSSTPGFTLWAAQVRLLDSASASTTTINWSTASISAVGYAGQTGASGTSARVCFARVSGNPTPVSGTITTSGSTSFPSSAQSSSTWGFSATWGAQDPNPSSTNSLYQSDGIYDPVTNQTTWSTPYISSLKVGALSAITVNTGGLTVSDYIQAGSANVSGSSMSGSGFIINSTGTFAFGNSSRNLSFNGSTLTMNGDLVVTGNLQANSVSDPSVVESTSATVFITTNQVYTIVTSGVVVPPASFSNILVSWSGNLFSNTTSGRMMYFSIDRSINGGSFTTVYTSIYRAISSLDDIISQTICDTPSDISSGVLVNYRVTGYTDNGTPNLQMRTGAIIVVQLLKR